MSSSGDPWLQRMIAQSVYHKSHTKSPAKDVFVFNLSQDYCRNQGQMTERNARNQRPNSSFGCCCSCSFLHYLNAFNVAVCTNVNVCFEWKTPPSHFRTQEHTQRKNIYTKSTYLVTRKWLVHISCLSIKFLFFHKKLVMLFWTSKNHFLIQK